MTCTAHLHAMSQVNVLLQEYIDGRDLANTEKSTHNAEAGTHEAQYRQC